ncbi:signal recognition particle-docking protein FtsY [Calditerricola yamamurae]
MSVFRKLKEALAAKTEAVTAKFRDGLAKTREVLAENVEALFRRTKAIDEEFFEELEEILIAADVGVKTALALVDELREAAAEQKMRDAAELKPLLVEKLVALMDEGQERAALNLNPEGLTVILFVGVNGVGKTTTIGKLAHRLKQEGKTVILAAGDTFRAGAIEQLEAWGRRVGADVIRHQAGADPAAVIYDAIQAAKSRGADVLLCDTAGRLQNKANLMEELKKIARVIAREVPGAPHETLLVVDATTGQNALSQAKAFGEAAKVTGIVLTKLDGTAKGGIVLAIRRELGVPVKFVGLGEKPDDLVPFDAEQFVAGLFAGWLEQPDEARSGG